MASSILPADPFGEGDDIVASFQIEDAAVRGRIARLGDGSLDPILKRHGYPRWAAHLLGEALTLSVLTAASLKFEGRIIVQAEGDGPVQMLVAEARSDGGVRGYLRLNEPGWERLERVNKGARPHIPQLIGKGVMAIILAPDDRSQDPYQGIVPIEGATLADCAEMYFNQSEQIPTRVRLTVAQVSETGGTMRWRSGGALLQRVAGDSARGDTDDDWDTASAHFQTLTDIELADPDLSAGRVLYRLFHESGVRMDPPRKVADNCTCNEARLRRTLSSLPREEVLSLVEEDGALAADCQFCGRVYRIPASELIEGDDA